MKKILFVLFVSGIVLSTSAQVQFGLQASGISSSAKVKEDGESFPGRKNLLGARLGGIAKINFNDKFSFMPELNFVLKGTRFTENETEEDMGYTYTYEMDARFSTNIIELPLNVAYSAPAGKKGSVVFGLGPVLSFGLGGKYNVDYTITSTFPGIDPESETIEGKIKFDGKTYDEVSDEDEDFHLKGLELGGNFFAGYQMNSGLFFRAGYNFGLSNLSPNDDTKYTTSYFGISIGYLFSKKAAK